MSDNISMLTASNLMEAIAQAVEAEQALGVCGQKVTQADMDASQSLINQTADNTGKLGTASTTSAVLGSTVGVVLAVSTGCTMAGFDMGSAVSAGLRSSTGALQIGKGVTDGLSAHYKADIDIEKSCSDAAGKAGKSASDLSKSSMQQAANASKAESAVIREMTYTKPVY